MSKETTYETIQEFTKKQGASVLVSTLEEFNSEKIKQSKTASYVKLNFQCKCGKIFKRDFMCLKHSRGLCAGCARTEGLSKRLSSEKQLEIITSKGLEYVEGEIRNHDSKFLVKCFCGNTFITTLRTIKNNSSERMMCKECRTCKSRERFRKPFYEIKDYLDSNGCKLLSSEENYINKNSKIVFIAKCGHEHTTTVAVIMRNTKHFVCKDCRKQVCAKENAYNWNGGYDNKKTKFRKTYEFKQWVKQVFKRDNYTCRCCGVKGVRLNAHHLDGYNWCIDKRTDIDNGITLCEHCHNDFHNKYGRGNNTKEQFKEYMLLYVNKVLNIHINVN